MIWIRQLTVGPFALLGLFLFSGCAFVDMKLPLSYAPAPEQPLGTGEVEIVRPPEPNIPKSKDGLQIIGDVRNGYGMHTADVVAHDPIPDWIANAFQSQFAAAGYTPRIVRELSPACKRGITLEVRQVRTEMDPGFWSVGGVGRVQVVMTVMKDGTSAEQILFSGIGDDRGMVGGGDELTNGLAKALRVSLSQATHYAAAAWKE